MWGLTYKQASKTERDETTSPQLYYIIIVCLIRSRDERIMPDDDVRGQGVYVELAWLGSQIVFR